MGAPRWSDEHLDALRRLYPSAPRAEVTASCGGRPWGSVARQAVVLGLRRARPTHYRGVVRACGNAWSIEHLDALRRLYPGAPREEVVAACGGRRWPTVARQAVELGLRRAREDAWTGEDNVALDLMWRERTPATITRHLGRTWKACIEQARALNLGPRLGSRVGAVEAAAGAPKDARDAEVALAEELVSIAAAAQRVGVTHGGMLRILAAYAVHYQALPQVERIVRPTPRPVRRAADNGPRRKVHLVVRMRAALDAWAWWEATELAAEAARRREVPCPTLRLALRRERAEMPTHGRMFAAWWDEFINKHVAPRVKRATTKTVDIRRAA